MNSNNADIWKLSHTRRARPLYHPLALSSLTRYCEQQSGSVLSILCQVQVERVSFLKLKIVFQLKQQELQFSHNHISVRIFFQMKIQGKEKESCHNDLSTHLTSHNTNWHVEYSELMKKDPFRYLK